MLQEMDLPVGQLLLVKIITAPKRDDFYIHLLRQGQPGAGGFRVLVAFKYRLVVPKKSLRLFVECLEVLVLLAQRTCTCIATSKEELSLF